MKPARLSLAAAVAIMLPGIGWSAVADAIRSDYADRVEHAERVFGDVRFVMGSGQAMEWLEMYVGRNLVGAYRDFDVQEVRASPDGKYFLAVSNTSLSSLAFAVIDRKGHVLFSRPHNTGDLHYCEQPSMRARYWINTAAANVRFELGRSPSTSPAREYLKSVTVQGCDGKDVLLGQAGAPIEQLPAPSPPAQRIAVLDSGDRGSFFIGSTIANLRNLDPSFGARTLTLMDGRRSGGQQPPLTSLPPALASNVDAAVGPQGSRQTTFMAVLPGSLGNFRIIERRWCEKDGSLCGADLLTSRSDGTVELLARDLLGEFIVLQDSQRVFSCENTLRETRAPVLIDANGGRTTLPSSPGGLRDCSRTGSGNEVRLVYDVMKAGRRHSLARVFDGSGTLLAETELDQAGKVEYVVAGKLQVVTVPGP